MLSKKFLLSIVAACLVAALLVGCGGGGGGSSNTNPKPIPIQPDPDDPPLQPNQSPSITSIAPASSSTEPIKLKTSEEQVISVSASDPDGDPLSYSWSVDKGTITPLSSKQEARYKAPTTTGAAVVKITVSDGKNSPVSANVYFLIGSSEEPLPENQPPTVTLKANPTSVEGGKSSTLTASASDPDGDPLIYTWIVNDGNIGEVLSDNKIVWISPVAAGTYSVTVSVSDNKAPAVQASVTITVQSSGGGGGGGGGELPFTNGLLGKYYKYPPHPHPPVDAFNPNSLVLERIDPAVNFDWGRNSPHPDLIDPEDGLPRDFSVRWTGHIRCDLPGIYSLRIKYDDGVRLFIGDDNDQLVNVIDGWATGPDVQRGNITLQGGKWYPIVVEYFEDESTAYVHLSWITPNGTEPEIVPTTMLRSD